MRRLSRKPNLRILLYFILLAGVIIAMSLLKNRGSENLEKPQPIESGGDTLDVGIEYGPMTLYREGDTLGGYSYDLLRQIASIGNLKLKFHPIVTISEALEGLRSGRFDIIVGSVPQTVAVSEEFAVTEPIYLDKQLLVQRADSSKHYFVASQLDLGGKTLHVLSDSPAIERIRAMSSEIGDTIYTVEEHEYGNEQLVILVATGEIDYAVVNEKTALAMEGKFDNLDMGTAVSFNQFQPWLLRREDSVICNRLDSLIVRVKAAEVNQHKK
ncbi:MAG: transporter substrate-binding domain-containing protein [Paramuribaculum sp.]|nr:transporter substrate-binding domain-containing protein [Paramuribaculum sp.]